MYDMATNGTNTTRASILYACPNMKHVSDAMVGSLQHLSSQMTTAEFRMFVVHRRDSSFRNKSVIHIYSGIYVQLCVFLLVKTTSVHLIYCIILCTPYV